MEAEAELAGAVDAVDAESPKSMDEERVRAHEDEDSL